MDTYKWKDHSTKNKWDERKLTHTGQGMRNGENHCNGKGRGRTNHTNTVVNQWGEPFAQIVKEWKEPLL